MSYTALARKWRPRSFEELSGQEHVRGALANALTAGRVHHAFLFTGTRGVGKTTIARIFAKCLNCDGGVTATPCGQCAACTDIDAGRFVDLLEVDAASRTKVEDTRDLLDNVQYMPSRGRYKIYLIDEVHMLSAHSFNALLKTLEEPPPHVKFLLATTDPQRLPITVLSRCLQFNLKRLSVGVISARLTHILKEEGIAAEPAAVRLVATAADGSLRDALSLLDQLLAFGGAREVREAEARAMLGTVDRQQVVQLAKLLAAGDMAALLAGARALDDFSPDYLALLEELNSLLARVALYQAAGTAYDEEEEVPAATLAELAAAIAPEDLQLFYQVGLTGRRDLPLINDQRSGFATTLVRMLAFRPGAELASPQGARGGAAGAGVTAAARATGAGAARAAAAGAPAAAPASISAAASPAPSGVPTAPVVPAGPAVGALALEPANWPAIIERMVEQGLAGLARQLASHCALAGRQGAMVRLLLDPRSQSIRTRGNEEKLAAALSRYAGEALRVQIELAEGPAPVTPARERAAQADERLERARVALEEDPNIQALRSQLGATIFADSVRPNFTEEN
ncbi:MAG: DNA polymerase III subunit gamma/tau [Proteobacteria bacterium]|nr:DNA polymerase III subunit gamma/tau [Pseudomonadota bacterium]